MLEFTSDLLKETNFKHLPNKFKINLICAINSCLIVSDTKFAIKIPLDFLKEKDYVFYCLSDRTPKVSDLKKGFTLSEIEGNVKLQTNGKEFIGIPFNKTENLWEMLKPNQAYSFRVNLDKLKEAVKELGKTTYLVFDRTKVLSMSPIGKVIKEYTGIVEEFTDFECNNEERIIGINKDFLEYILKLKCKTIDLKKDNNYQVKMDIFAGYKF